jgi:hypothetical protein
MTHRDREWRHIVRDIQARGTGLQQTGRPADHKRERKRPLERADGVMLLLPLARKRAAAQARRTRHEVDDDVDGEGAQQAEAVDVAKVDLARLSGAGGWGLGVTEVMARPQTR